TAREKQRVAETEWRPVGASGRSRGNARRSREGGAMKGTVATVVLCALVLGPAHSSPAQDLFRGLFPQNPTFTTLSITPLAIAGLTGDAGANLYTTGRGAAVPTPCPVWRIASTATPPVTPVQVGSIPNSPTACNPSGITFDRSGNLYVADANLGGVIW